MADEKSYIVDLPSPQQQAAAAAATKMMESNAKKKLAAEKRKASVIDRQNEATRLAEQLYAAEKAGNAQALRALEDEILLKAELRQLSMTKLRKEMSRLKAPDIAAKEESARVAKETAAAERQAAKEKAAADRARAAEERKANAQYAAEQRRLDAQRRADQKRADAQRAKLERDAAAARERVLRAEESAAKKAAAEEQRRAAVEENKIAQEESKYRRQSLIDDLNRQEQQKNQQARIATAREQLGPEKYGRVEQMVQAKGMSMDNLSKVRFDEPAGITNMTFRQEAAKGVIKELTVSSDRFGQVLYKTNKRFMDFFESVAANTKEVLRWSIGVGIVYGALAKFQELTQKAIDSQSKLADITVTLGDSQRDLNEVYNDAATIATSVGESINGVLEAYTMSYRATGSIKDVNERTVVSNKLLTDSLILAKLSSLDAAESIDALSGALRQLQGQNESSADALMKGTELLDKWVAVSNSANVDMATLATAFSITSESAENAGLSVEELNAVIGSLSEKIGGLGGKETGNAVRALIGGVYSDIGAKTLASYGIAVTDASGKMKDFLDISNEIYLLYRDGIISEDQLNEIGLALGGGVRRGQQYVSFLTDQARIQEIVNSQTNAAGSAQVALAKKMDTVETSISRLDNSFQSLAHTLGGDGGMLDSYAGMLDITNLLITGTTKLADILNQFTIPAALLAVGGLMSRNPVMAKKYQTYTGLVGGHVADMFGGLGGMTTTYTANGPVQSGRVGNFMGRVASQNVIPTMIGSYPAMMRAGQGEWAAAGVDLAGAFAGSFAGPLGSIVGGAIADAFVGQALAHKEDFANFFAEVGDKAEDKDGAGGYDRQAAITTATFKKLGGGSTELGKIIANFGRLGAETWSLGESNMTNEQAALAALSILNPDAGELYVRAVRNAQRGADLTAGGGTPSENTMGYSRQLALNTRYGGQINYMAQGLRGQLQSDLISGRINNKAYRSGMEATARLTPIVTKLASAAGDEIDRASNSINGMSDVFAALTTTVVYGSEEQVNSLTELADTIWKVEDAIAKGLGAQQVGGVFYSQEQLPGVLGDLKAQLAAAEKDVRVNAVKSRLSLPSMTDVEGLSPQGLNMLWDEVLREQDRQLNSMIDEGLISQTDANALKENTKSMGFDLGKNFGIYFKKGLSDEFSGIFNDVYNKMQEEGALGKELQKDMGLQIFDLTQADFNTAMAGYGKLKQDISRATQGAYKFQEEDFLAIYKDGMNTEHYDMKLVQYLLSQILDVNEKQLMEGVYNLPTDSSFYVPYHRLAAERPSTPSFAGGYAGGAEGKRYSLPTYPTKSYGKYGPYQDENIGYYTGLISENQIPAAITTGGAYKDLTYATPTMGFSRGGRTGVGAAQPTQASAIDWWQRLMANSSPSRGFMFGNAVGQAASNIFNPQLGWGGVIGAGTGVPGNPGGSVFEELRGILGTIGDKLKTNLNLNVTSRTTLVLDGKVLATSIKTVLAQELVNYQNNSSNLEKMI